MLSQKEFYGIPGGTILAAICAAALKRKPCKKNQKQRPPIFEASQWVMCYVVTLVRKLKIV